MATKLEFTTLQTEVPVRLLAEMQSLVDAGWFHSLDEVIHDALRRFLDSHRPPREGLSPPEVVCDAGPLIHLDEIVRSGQSIE